MKTHSIVAEGIGKEYLIGGAELHYDSFRDMLSGVLRNPLRKFRTLRGEVSDNKFWALKDIDFTVNQGDVVGVIGQNGAGKSTLLKVLSRITAPTLGRVTIQGRVASLLEIGTGFHPELTGRENIYLNGSILGMSRHDIEKRFDEIVEFADVTRFLDTPVKRYSSGMHVRLAFSVAAHLDTDVLMVDEVLAVGDQKFQEKCLGKLGAASSEGRTVMFVSHNLSSVAQLCEKAIVLNQGKIAFQGGVLDGISAYNGQLRDTPVLADEDYIGELYPQVRFNAIRVNDSVFCEGLAIDPLLELNITVAGECVKSQGAYRSVLSVRKNGQLLFSVFDGEQKNKLPSGRFSSHFQIPEKLLMPGDYTFSLGGIGETRDEWLWTRDYCFKVLNRWQADYDSTISVAGLVNVDRLGYREHE